MDDYDKDFRRDEEEDGEEEIDENDYKTQKDAILLAIDVSKSMLESPPASESKKADRDSATVAALKCAYHLMQQRIISNPKDMMGILLFGTEKSKFQDDGHGHHRGLTYPHCYLFTELDVPAAADVRTLKALVEGGEDDDNVLTPATEIVAMTNVLFCANQIFTTKAANFGSRRLFIITDNDDPHMGDKAARSAAAVRAKDLYDLGVIIELFPISRGEKKFDLTKFYDDIIYRDPTAEANMSEVRTSKSGDGLTLLNSLISNINSKQSPKRSLFSNLPFEIAPGLKISVKGYNVLHRQAPMRSCFIWLDGETPQIASGETTRIAEDSARTVEKTEIKKAYKFGGEHVHFTPEEQKSLKDFGAPVLRIIGFKKRSLIPIWASVKKSTFIYPSEEDYVGSTRVFGALWRKLLKDDKAGIAWYIPRVNAIPLLVAIIPSKEQSDEESGTPYLPAGLWLCPLPYADDMREGPDVPEVNRASGDLIDRMRTVVQQLQLPKGIFNPTKYPNPSLQWFYKILQALALEEEVPDKMEDATQPKYKAMNKRAGGYLDEWKDALEKDISHARKVSAVKREAEEDEAGERPAKKAKASAKSTSQLPSSGLSNAQLRAAVDSGGLAKMKVADLRDVLGARGLNTSGVKSVLVEKIEQWAEENL